MEKPAKRSGRTEVRRALTSAIDVVRVKRLAVDQFQWPGPYA